MIEPSLSLNTEREAVIRKLAANRSLAHKILFKHRHPSSSPPFHKTIIDDWHSPAERVVDIAFRGSAKSTLSEEAVVLQACLREFKNCVLLGESETRAKERLTSIKHEFNTNEFLIDLFGDLGEGPASVWTETKIVLANGVCIQALGRGQSMRGIKHLEWRPDLLVPDDMEDKESVIDPEQRKKWRSWFFSVVLPAMVPPHERRIRVAGTPLDRDALLERMALDNRWITRRIPIKYKDPQTGEWVASWPERFPLNVIDAIEQEFLDNGEHATFLQEYMCVPEDPAEKAFTKEMFRSEPVIRDWQSVYAMIDPARTAKAKTSAQTGVAIWSWVNNRLVLWDAYGRFWKPDEIINDMFEIDEKYEPIVIGVETNGLEEFVLQPLRQAQVQRGRAIPIRDMRAPKSKPDFIKGLQPFFNAREVIFAKPLPELEKQLLAFPTGNIDIPNALAYALTLRPGAPVYDSFGVLNTVEDMEPIPGLECFLALNVSAACTTGVLFQMAGEGLTILSDWAREGEPGLVVQSIVQAAGVEAGRPPALVAPPRHFDSYDTLGLRAAVARLPARLRKGGDEYKGREEIRSLLKKTTKGFPALLVARKARWTLNAFAGGYAREMKRGGILEEEAAEGVYKTLMEGLESFAALMRMVERDNDPQPRMLTTADGRRYKSALASR